MNDISKAYWDMCKKWARHIIKKFGTCVASEYARNEETYCPCHIAGFHCNSDCKYSRRTMFDYFPCEDSENYMDLFFRDKDNIKSIIEDIID